MNAHVNLFGESAPPRRARWRCLPVPGTYRAAKIARPVIPPPKNGPRRIVVVDIGMRMLTPRELARAQDFPDSYILAPIYRGKPLSETEQRHKIGNSVCEGPAAAFVEANYRPPLEWGVETAPFMEAAE